MCYDNSKSLQVESRPLLGGGTESPFYSPLLHHAFVNFKPCVQEVLPQVASLFILSEV